MFATRYYALQYGGIEEKEIFTIASDAAFADDQQNGKALKGIYASFLEVQLTGKLLSK